MNVYEAKYIRLVELIQERDKELTSINRDIVKSLLHCAWESPMREDLERRKRENTKVIGELRQLLVVEDEITKEEFEKIANSVDVVSKRTILDLGPLLSEEKAQELRMEDMNREWEEIGGLIDKTEQARNIPQPEHLYDNRVPEDKLEYKPLSPEQAQALIDSITKPSLGLKPRYLVVEERISEIIGAMQRYTEDNKPIPSEWIEELSELNEWNKAQKAKRESD